MDKIVITDLLEEKHSTLFTWLEKQPTENWEKGPKNKWTVGQQIQHLVDSLQQLNSALSYPNFILKYKFGICNREIRDYETVAKNYQNKLIEFKDRARAFNQNLKKPLLNERNNLLSKLQIQNKKLQYKTSKLKDKSLDTLLLPHPLMGRMTLREIIMWTAHHTEHHTTILKENYSD
jgi:hypothetical protein